jgi:hypothetical protein
MQYYTAYTINMSKPFLFSLGLWMVSAIALGTMFVRGSTGISSDNRTAVIVNPAEKDLILAEMRVLLAAVQGTVSGLHTGKRTEMAAALRAAGMAQAADVNPALMAKLPLAFKQSGMSVHADFDSLAEAVERGATEKETLERLDSVLQRCVACHAGYRLEGR